MLGMSQRFTYKNTRPVFGRGQRPSEVTGGENYSVLGGCGGSLGVTRGRVVDPRKHDRSQRVILTNLIVDMRMPPYCVQLFSCLNLRGRPCHLRSTQM